MEKECGSLSKTRNIIGKASHGLGPGPSRTFNFGSWESNFSFLSRAVVISPKAVECPVCDTLEISCTPFMQHCWICILLTSSHCMIASAAYVSFSTHPLLEIHV